MKQQKPPRDLTKFVDIKKAAKLLSEYQQKRRASGWQNNNFIMMYSLPETFNNGQFIISITQYENDRDQGTERFFAPLEDWSVFLERFGLIELKAQE